MNKCEKCGEKKSCHNWIKEVVWSVTTYIAASAIGATAAIFGLSPEKIIEKEVQYIVASGVEMPDGEVKGFGWYNDPKEVEQVVKGLKYPVFAKTPAGEVVNAEIPNEMFLWQLSKTAYKRYVPTRDQKSVGSCVAFGAVCALEYLQCSQAVTAMKAGFPVPEFKDLSTEYIYGTSRVQVGGGRINGDGSTGSWAASAATKYGIVPRGVYGRYDLSNYNESTCRQFGNTGPPNELLAVGKEHLLKSISPIRTTDELLHALASQYPVTVASSIGFGNSSRSWVRDVDGILYPSGVWQHQQCVIGAYKHPAKGWLFYIMNSWGNWVSGPSGAGDPPPGGYYVTEKTMQRMLDDGDSWAYSNLDGFLPRVLDWFVVNDKRNRLLDKDFLNTFALFWRK